MADRQPDLRIEAVMLKKKPDLMPWARYILAEMQKEDAERDGLDQCGSRPAGKQ